MCGVCSKESKRQWGIMGVYIHALKTSKTTVPVLDIEVRTEPLPRVDGWDGYRLAAGTW